MSKKEALRVQKELQTLQIDQIKEFYMLPKAQRKEEGKILQPMLEDKLFMRTGIELSHFMIIFNGLNLEDDPENLEMKKEA